jgi:hypothetical protein
MTRQEVHIDPGITAILGESDDRTEERRMSPQQRKRKRRQAKRQSVTWELDASLVAIVRQIADALDISPASATNRLLFDALQRYAAGTIDFDDKYLRPSRAPRYLWVVDINTNGLQNDIDQRLAEVVPDDWRD